MFEVAFATSVKGLPLQNYSMLDVQDENRFVVAKRIQAAPAGEPAFSVRRTRVATGDPALALGWGGSPGCLARLNLQAVPEHRIMFGGRVAAMPARGAMESFFQETSETTVWPVEHPIDQISFELPCEALVRWAQNRSVGLTLRPQFASGSGAADPVIQAFGRAVLPLLEADAPPSQFFVDHMLDGVAAYMFDAAPPRGERQKGGLAPWQERRAKEMMESRVVGDLSLHELASACGLSVAHFSRAFRNSCGLTPHKWLMARRVDRAKLLLMGSDLSLAEIAAECRFSDQAHLSNVFSRNVGIPPGAFRRRWRGRPDES